MSLLRQSSGVIKKAVFGDTLIPQEFTIGLADPQAEVSVWLHGAGAPRDVTRCHSTACLSPLTICIASDGEQTRNGTLKFLERGGDQRVL